MQANAVCTLPRNPTTRLQAEPITDISVCGNNLNGGTPATSGCSMLCEGNKLEFCGGPGKMNLYSYGGVFTPPASTAGPDPTTT